MFSVGSYVFLKGTVPDEYSEESSIEHVIKYPGKVRELLVPKGALGEKEDP